MLAMTPRHTSISAHKEQGFSLLEALVTVVVVSIGLLGILGLQTASMANTHISGARSNATVATDNFVARMRANPEADYDGIESYTDFQAVTTTIPECDQTPCSVDDIKTLAIWEWSHTLQQKLPNGRGFVDCNDDDVCQRYRITIVWDEHNPTADAYQANANNAAVDLCENDPPDHQITDRCFVTEVRP